MLKAKYFPKGVYHYNDLERYSNDAKGLRNKVVSFYKDIMQKNNQVTLLI